MNKASRPALISLGLLIVYGTFIATATAQSLTSGPQPSPEIESLTKALAGEWSLSVKFEPSASAPKGSTNAGEETWRPGPGGFTLLEEEHLPMPEADAFLLGIIWWNTTTKSLQGMECQNLLPYTCDVKGAQNDITMNWDGKQFVIDEVEINVARGLVRHHSHIICSDWGIWRRRRAKEAAIHDSCHENHDGAEQQRHSWNQFWGPPSIECRRSGAGTAESRKSPQRRLVDDV
jgi:hypothetical protein